MLDNRRRAFQIQVPVTLLWGDFSESAWAEVIAVAAAQLPIQATPRAYLDAANELVQVGATLVIDDVTASEAELLIDRFVNAIRVELNAREITPARVAVNQLDLPPIPNLELWVDPGEASADVVADVLVAISNLHRAAGGDGLVFSTDGDRVVPAAVESL